MSSPTAPSSIVRRRAAFAFILVTVWLDYLAQSLSFPLLPRLARILLNGDAAEAARWVGWLEVGWAIPQFFAAPVFGMLSDRFGRRPVILISLAGVAGELVVNAMAPDIWWLLAGRMLCGVCCGAIAPAMAYVADVTPEADRTRRYGWVNAAIWAAVIMGPAIGGALTVFGLRTAFWVAAVVAGLNALYGLFVLPESLAPADRAPLRWSKANPWSATDLIFRRPGLAVLGFALLLIWLAFQATGNMTVLYTAYRYGWSALTFGLFISVIGLANIAVQAGLAGWIAKKVGERAAVLGGLALQAIGLAAMGLAPTGPIYALASLPQALGAVATPALQSMMSARVGPDEQGRLQGAIGSISSLTSIVAPVAFTQLFAWTIAGGRPVAWSGATMLTGAGLSALAALVVLIAARTPRVATH